jgi:hypothetical protein
MRPLLRRGPDPRTVAFGLVVAVFIAALLAVSDYLSRVGSQSLIARELQHALGSRNRPSIHVHGAFFVPQVVDGVYHDVEIDVAPLSENQLRIADLHADLVGVRLPFHDVLVRHAPRIVIDRTKEVATLRYRDIDSYLAATGVPVKVGPAGHGWVRFTGSVPVLGRTVSTSAEGKVGARGDQLRITPVRWDTGVGALDRATQLLLGQRLTLEIPLQSLPFGQTITGVTAGPDGIRVQARGTDIVIESTPNGPVYRQG